MRRTWLSFSLTCLRFVSKEADNLEVPTAADKANHNETKPSEKDNNSNNNKTTSLTSQAKGLGRGSLRHETFRWLHSRQMTQKNPWSQPHCQQQRLSGNSRLPQLLGFKEELNPNPLPTGWCQRSLNREPRFSFLLGCNEDPLNKQ